MSLPMFNERRRAFLRQMAEETLAAIHAGGFRFNGHHYPFADDVEASKHATRYYGPHSHTVAEWAKPQTPHRSASPTTTEASFLQISTLEAARLIANTHENNPGTHNKAGLLNFASATKPGGGFINGAEAQEESLARASTLYPTLKVPAAQAFYDLHSQDSKHGYYSHAMIYSPNVVVFRDDEGGWTPPFKIDMLTSAAVNAAEVRNTTRGRSSDIERRIENEMWERMGRILFLFEKEGVRDIVLGSFGTGVFRNDIGVIARIWADLLSVDGARFRHSFDRVIFAIMGERTFSEFQDAYKARERESITTKSPTKSGWSFM